VKTTVKPTKCSAPSAAIVALNPYRSLCHRSPAEPGPQGRHRPDEVRRRRQPRPRTQPPAFARFRVHATAELRGELGLPQRYLLFVGASVLYASLVIDVSR